MLKHIEKILEVKSSPLYQNYTPTVIFEKSKTRKWIIIQEASGSSTVPNAARGTSCKAWNSPADYLKFIMYKSLVEFNAMLNKTRNDESRNVLKRIAETCFAINFQ